MEKNDRLIGAAKRNDLNYLTNLSDTAELINCVEPATDNNLLQIAVLYQSADVFHHLLAIEDYPLNHHNKKGLTALNLCFSRECDPDDAPLPLNLRFSGKGEPDDGTYSSLLRRANILNYQKSKMKKLDHFACELIKNGISLDCVELDENETLLHYALDKSFDQVAKLLIQMGYDVDARIENDLTPLSLCFYAFGDGDKITELVAALLCHGADPTPLYSTLYGFNIFEYALTSNEHLLLELVQSFIIDDYTSLDVSFALLVTLALERSPHFHSIIEYTNNVIVGDVCKYHYDNLFAIDPGYLNILLRKCPDAMWQAISEALNLKLMDGWLMDYSENGNSFLEILSRLLETDQRDVIIEDINDQLNLHNILQNVTDESVALERICFLLSYGIKINEYTLNIFYGKFGFGELFKLVADMDIQPICPGTKYPPNRSLPIYSIYFDLKLILDKPYDHYDVTDLKKLLGYFADEKLRAFCYFHAKLSNTLSGVPINIPKQPKIPLLVELARDVFRKFFVKTFKIESPMQFYTVVDELPIALEHKKIIRLEKTLY